MMTAEPKPQIKTKPIRISRAQLESLYRQHAKSLYAWILGRLNNKADAEDVLQQCFLKLALRGMTGSNEKAYLFTTARHLMIDQVRQKNRQPKHVTGDSIFHLIPERMPTEQDAKASEVSDCLKRLSPDLRDIVLLKLYSGMGFREMETLLDIPRTTLHDRYRKALTELRSMMDKGQES